MHGAVGKVHADRERKDVLEFDELGAHKAGRVNIGRRLASILVRGRM